MATARGLVGAFGCFLAAFILHIVGSATGQRWLFALAVALIFVTATAFPVVALVFAGRQSPRGRARTVSLGLVTGTVLTASALWAPNDRSITWWVVPVAVVMVAGVSGTLTMARRWALAPGPTSARVR